MFGPAYFGSNFYGENYFGDAGVPFEPGQAAGGVDVIGEAEQDGTFAPDYWAPDYFTGTYWSAVMEGSAAAPDLLSAIWAYAESDSALFGGFGRPGWLWLGKGARGAPLPYAVVFEVGNVEVGLTTGPYYHEHLAIQFNVFSAAVDEAERLGRMLLHLFAPYDDQVALRFADGTDLARWPGDGNILERDPAKGVGGADVYIQRINFVWRVRRSYEPA